MLVTISNHLSGTEVPIPVFFPSVFVPLAFELIVGHATPLIMVDQAPDTGNPNDFSCRCRYLTGTKHGAIVEALMSAQSRTPDDSPPTSFAKQGHWLNDHSTRWLSRHSSKPLPLGASESAKWHLA